MGTVIDFKTRQEVTVAELSQGKRRRKKKAIEAASAAAVRTSPSPCSLLVAASKIHWITQQAIAEHSLGCELDNNASDQPFQSTCTWESGCTTCHLKNAISKTAYLAMMAAGTPEMTEHLQKK